MRKGELDLALKQKEVASKETQKQADVAKVQFAANIAKSNLEEVQSRVKKAIIVAPAPGMVVTSKFWDGNASRSFTEGDTVWPGRNIIQLPDLSSMLVKVNVGESDAPKVTVGMQVLIRLEAVPKVVFHGTVKEISKLATEDNWWENGRTPGKKNFDVTVSIKEVNPKVLKPGMTADAEFIQTTIKDGVYVPIEAVTERNSKTYVIVKSGKQYNRLRVVTGMRNDDFVIITKGLIKGQVLALRDPSLPADAQESISNNNPEEKQTKKSAPIPAAAK